MAKQITKWKADDGSEHETEAAALRADCAHVARQAAKQLGSVLTHMLADDAETIASAVATHADAVMCYVDAERVADAGPGAQDLRDRAHALGNRLRAWGRSGETSITMRELSELAGFAEDVAALGFPCMSKVARERGPIEDPLVSRHTGERT